MKNGLDRPMGGPIGIRHLNGRWEDRILDILGSQTTSITIIKISELASERFALKKASRDSIQQAIYALLARGSVERKKRGAEYIYQLKQ